MNVRYGFGLGVAVVFLAFSGQASAEDYLTAAQVRDLVVGNTMHAAHIRKGFRFKVYFHTDGRTAYRTDQGEVVETTYGFDGDRHCIFWRGKDRCANIRDNGDGTYTRVNKRGKAVVKWDRVVDGRDL